MAGSCSSLVYCRQLLPKTANGRVTRDSPKTRDERVFGSATSRCRAGTLVRCAKYGRTPFTFRGRGYALTFGCVRQCDCSAIFQHSSSMSETVMKPLRLQPGDRVRFVSPASPPEPEKVAFGARMLEGWGLRVEIGAHAFDKNGHFLAGRDEDRLTDLNDALRDSGVRAIFTTTGGKGAYRIAHALDFAAARRDPKPLIGYSDITILHLALWRQCRLAGLHGPYVGWNQEYYGNDAALHL